jgi:hypothetical protein
MAKPELLPGENLIDHWTVNLIIGGSRYTDKVHITNQRVLVAKNFAPQLGAVPVQAVGTEWIGIPKSAIVRTEPKSSLLNKRVTLHLEGGSTLVIDRGILSIQPILQALAAQ